MKVRINGEDCVLVAPLSIDSLLIQRDLRPEAVAVEYNGDIIPRQQWGSTLLMDNDVVEIVSFMCGG